MAGDRLVKHLARIPAVAECEPPLGGCEVRSQCADCGTVTLIAHRRCVQVDDRDELIGAVVREPDAVREP